MLYFCFAAIFKLYLIYIWATLGLYLGYMYAFSALPHLCVQFYVSTVLQGAWRRACRQAGRRAAPRRASAPCHRAVPFRG